MSTVGELKDKDHIADLGCDMLTVEIGLANVTSLNPATKQKHISHGIPTGVNFRDTLHLPYRYGTVTFPLSTHASTIFLFARTVCIYIRCQNLVVITIC